MPYVLHLLSTFSTVFVELLTTGGYFVLGASLSLEGLPIIGSFIPGHVVIIAAGFLAKLGILNIVVVLVVSTLATVFGDILGFLLGRRFGYEVVHRLGKVFRFKTDYIDEKIEKAKVMIDEHAGKTIIFGKFSPITRPLTPFLVGASGVHIKTFWIYNIIGGILWVFSSVLLGYIFGASYHVVAGYFGKLVVSAIIIIVFILWGFRLANRRFHVFKKYEVFMVILNVLALWTLAKTIQDSFSLHSFMSNFDIVTNIFMAEHVTPFLAHIAVLVTNVGSTVVTIGLGILVGAGLLVKKKWRRGAIMILSVCSTAVVVTVMKELFMRVRPSDALVHLLDPSFPSGHASLAAAFFVALAYVFVPRIPSLIKRELFIVICVLCTIAIGLSRVILNVHWASDVIAGWALGMFLATGSVLLVRYVSGLLIKK